MGEEDATAAELDTVGEFYIRFHKQFMGEGVLGKEWGLIMGFWVFCHDLQDG